MTTIEATWLTTNDNDIRHERLDGQCAMQTEHGTGYKIRYPSELLDDALSV